MPDRVPQPGTPIDLSWRVHWTLDSVPASARAQVRQTRRGHGFRPKDLPPQRQQMHVDFAGPALASLAAGAPVEVLASGNANARALRANAYPNPERGGWRVSLEFDRVDASQPLELRLQLRLAGNVLTETWVYALAPE